MPRIPSLHALPRWAALAAGLLIGHATAQAQPPSGAGTSPDRGQGIAVAIGGALKYDNDPVWQRLVDLAGGPGARYVVFATAAGNPERSAARIVAALNRRGAIAEAIPVAPKLKDSDARAAARDLALVAQVLAARGVYFSGGAQERIVDTLLDTDGRPTPVLDAIWQVYRRGGVVAGSSAGAAVMSTTMFRDAPGVLDVMKFGLRDGKDIDRGLGFVGPEVLIDQHFLKRGRFARLLVAMQHEGYRIGVGVDENTAAIFHGDMIEVLGYKGILVADLSDASHDPRLPAFNLRNARLSYLERGDRYDLKARRTLPSPDKLREPRIDPNGAGFEPHFTDDAFHPDVLGDTAVANLMTNLIDNRQREVIGLAFGAPDSKRPELGFEFRFRKTAGSLGWYTGAFGGEDYTVTDIRLDVTPITLRLPLYEAFTPTPAPELQEPVR